MLQPIQYALAGIAPVRAPATAETASAVPETAEGERTGNDVPRDRGTEAERLAQEARELLDDPRRPVGPPPAFQANLLDAERARLRAGAPAAAEKDDRAAAGPDPAGTAPAEQPAVSGAYVGPAGHQQPRELDLMR